MRIIAAIDIMDGTCVRLTQGDYSRRTVYGREPLDMARELEDHGMKYLHLVDLDGAREGKVKNQFVLETITGKTGLQVDFSGGIRSDEDIRTAFGCGASQVTCGSIAVTEPELFLRWLKHYGPERIILGADFRQRKVATGGWLSASETDITDFLRNYRSQGVVYAMCTDIEKDGMLGGPSVDIYKEIVRIDGLSLIASGGISSAEDLQLVREAGCEAVIIGKAIYEGRITLKELARIC
ncbi:MAG: 1-(5-phosphoribosyl)-5-[(5-phosphoribosylamino)methylideneamino]imidazole-4-carboxamide isomerase [Bacteroidales bacterium]|nr:1-(5-phosphoribosyl)-5-[(5-phosphoribosylamino)methylideneamino]imidazole-4-carboxamide isomerase [Bacteroidales bacterium]